MYRTSSDRRFYKIKKDIRGAFMTLVLQKDHYSDISITEVAELADINRKTFYLHYDSIDDILTEYADDLSADFMNYLYSQEEFSVESLFDWIGRHAEEKEFFRKMAAEDRIMPFTDKCRRVLRDYLQAHMIAEKGQTARSQKLVASYTAAGLAQILVEYASGETDLDRETLIRETRRVMENGWQPAPAPEERKTEQTKEKEGAAQGTLAGKAPVTGIPNRNYENDARMEHINAMQDYLSLVRDPVTSRNARQMVEIQNRRIRELMEAAWEIPFYRERFRRSGTRPADYRKAEDLYRFPVLTREELESWLAAELSGDAGRFNAGHIHTTSGTTGKALRIPFSPNENAWLTANWLRVLALPGYNPFTGKTMSRTLLPGQEGRDMDSMIQRFGILRRKAMKDSDDMQELIREINAYRPDYLYNYQEILAGIAAYASERGIRVWKPQYYTATGAPLTEETRVLLTEVFGPGLTDSYGLNETGSCIVRLPGKKYYQVNSDTHVVNIYNDSLTGPALTGQAVITPLFKTELPVINYVSGDGMESYQKQGLRFIRTVDSRAYSSGS